MDSFMCVYMGQICDKPVAEDRDWGTIASHSVAIMGGASMIRVHNVPASVDSAKITDAIRLFPSVSSS